MIKLVSLLFIFILSYLGLLQFNPDSNSIKYSNLSDKQIQVGEEIVYVVKYLFIPIGEIRLKVTNLNEVDSIYSAIAYIDSYSGIPFVNLHQIYETKFNKKQKSVYFKGTILEDDTTYTIYRFDYKRKMIHVIKGSKTKNEIWTDSTAVLDREYLDGLSLFYFARMRTGKTGTYNVSVFINEKSEKTFFNCYDNSEKITISSIDYPIDCVYLKGETEFRGIFGLTGGFEGWFSNDNFGVPIYAKLNVIIGSVSVELKKWKNKQWQPPRYKN